MIPIVALIGHPNVGKSTLFNRLTRKHDALVANVTGLTRDRKYGHAEWKGHKFIVIDTGGIYSTEEGIEIQIAKQSLIAIKEAHIILFIVDGRAGLISTDQSIAQYLRRYQKTTIIVANKIDDIDIESAVSDFYALGMGDIVPITASHGRGIDRLLDQILLLLIDLKRDSVNNEDKLEPDLDNQHKVLTYKKEKAFFEKGSPPIKLAIVGRPNAGKSTLINHMLGEERVVVYDTPGTTRDSICIPMEYNKLEYILIDTAGVRKRAKITETVEKFSIIKTLQAIEYANVVMLIVDACEGISDQDLSLISFILNSGRSLVIAVNKWDKLSSNAQINVKQSISHRLGFINFIKVHFISALYSRGIGNLFKSVNEAYACATNRVGTALLTRIMYTATDECQPPLVRGHRVKLKYAHSGGYNPPIVVIHGTHVKDLKNSYKRYLMNYFRRALKIIGTPVRLQFNETQNPFAR